MIRRLTVRVCADADRAHIKSLRAYGHTFCQDGPVICVASEFFGISDPGHRDGILAHEVGHLLAGPHAGEEDADRAFEAETGVRIRYKDGPHGRCLQWLSPKDRKLTCKTCRKLLPGEPLVRGGAPSRFPTGPSEKATRVATMISIIDQILPTLEGLVGFSGGVGLVLEDRDDAHGMRHAVEIHERLVMADAALRLALHAIEQLEKCHPGFGVSLDDVNQGGER